VTSDCVTVGDARMVSDVRGRLGALHDRCLGTILPDIRQNSPQTTITDGSGGVPCGERGPDLRNDLCRPLDQGRARCTAASSSRPARLCCAGGVVPAAVTAQPLGVPMPGQPSTPIATPATSEREWSPAHHASLTDGHTVEVTSGSIKPPRRIQTHTIQRGAAECRTKPVTGRIAKVTALLAGPRFATAPLANELREQIGLFRTYSAARDLPEMPT
jgi:hypothetical protein